MKGNLKIISAMLIFGSIGVLVKNMSLSSSEIAFLRAVIGSLFLICVSLFVKQRPSLSAIKENIVLLLLSGAAIGVNWILLFQAYKYTTISNATLSYYFAPIFVVVMAPFVLKEKLTPVKLGCIIAAMVGLLFIVDLRSGTNGAYHHAVGILYGLSAAVLYASVILMNKFIKNLTGFETTLAQLVIAALVLLPYVLANDELSISSLNVNTILLILLVGVLHTGIAYYLYFTSIKELKGQTIAVLSYIDPVAAVILAAVFLKERMSMIQILGGLLILGSAFLSERADTKLRKQNL